MSAKCNQTTLGKTTPLKILPLLCLAFFLQSSFLSGQPFTSKFYFNSPNDKYILEKVAKFNRRKARTESDALSKTEQFRDDLHKAGYLTAAIDSISIKGDTLMIWMYCGQRFISSVLHLNSEEDTTAELTGAVLGYSNERAVLPGSSLTSITGFLNQQGYPLARATISNMTISGDTLITYASVDRGAYYVWDTLEIKGNLRINNTILQRIIRIRAGKPYNNQLLAGVEKHLATLPFLINAGGYSVVLTGDGKARLLLNLEKQKASGFNGIIGFGPDKQKPSKLILSGDVALDLNNAFRRAEEIKLNWQSIQGDEQLFIDFRQPYLRWFPFGISGRFGLLKKGDQYYRLNLRGGVVVSPAAGSTFSVWTDHTSGRVLDRSIYTNAVVMPPFTDFETNLFGLGYEFGQVDLRVNPGKGHLFSGELAAGQMKTIKSGDIPEKLFEGIETEGRHARGELTFGIYLPLTQRWILRPFFYTSGVYGTVASENSLSFIGGINTIRGFDERSITASSFALGSLEIRYRFERESHFKVFIDGGWYEKRLGTLKVLSDTPFGFGAGISLPSPAGHLQISYAWGIQQDNPLDLRTGRLHFGLQARF